MAGPALPLSRQRESRNARELLKRLGIPDGEATGSSKLSWHGRVTSVQPRIRLTRSFDESQHTYLGYALRIDGRIGDEACEVWLGVGKRLTRRIASRSA